MAVDLPTGFGPLQRVPETGSTNADLLAADGPTGEVLVTAHQTAGRGRFARVWEEPPGSSLLFSVRLRPRFGPAGLPWLSPLTGLALAEAVGRRVGAVTLKWPNDVLVDGAKVAGILVEARGGVAVIGAGCNVTQPAGSLPVPTATSLAASGATDLDPDALLSDVLAGLARRYAELEAAAGDAQGSGLLAEYTAVCSTVGREVTADVGGELLTGTVTGIAPSGALVLAAAGGERVLTAGDVTHVR